MKQRRTIDLITLGCSKNLVDSERLIKQLADAGFDVRHDPEPDKAPADIVIVNTCGFINDAKEESIDTILRYAAARSRGDIEALYVMGCLSERYRAELPAEIPEVDAWYGKTDWSAITSMLAKKHPATAPYDRVITTPRHHAYLKIAEGCNRFCAFCAIPLITGRYHSRPFDEILAEVRMLVERGVREFNIIAQDLSAYGEDLYSRNRLAELIESIALTDGVEWIRLHYAYPTSFPMELLDVMARHSNICRYIDIALQHSADKVLANMRRHITAQQQTELLAEIRRRVPGIHIRTTLMVGFPGEGEEEFNDLLNFVRTQRFERMGAFAYSEEEDTFAARNYTDSVPAEVKQQRLDKLMALQEEIAMEHQAAKVGRRMRVVIDRIEGDNYVGRTEFDSPEVDPEVLIPRAEAKLEPGNFYYVKIVEALPFELIATIDNSETDSHLS